MDDKYVMLFILVFFGIMLYHIQTNHNNLQKKEKFTITDVKKRIYNLKDKISKTRYKKNVYINSEFLEIQYNKDYTDTINAIDNLTSQKELFNFNFLPVLESKPDERNVKLMVKWFIKKLNYEIMNNVGDFINKNSGWTDAGKLPTIKSGSEKQLDYLGIPKLHNEPAQKATVKLISIDKAEQYTTEAQIRFIIYIIIQKHNVYDQMILKVLFFMERDTNNNNEQEIFFSKDLNNEQNNKQTINIEQIFIVGYLTNKGIKKTKSDKFNDYEIEKHDGITSQKQIINTMIKKHKEREGLAADFIKTLDAETQDIHNVPETERGQYKNTRTIIDDLKQLPQNSFNDINV